MPPTTLVVFPLLPIVAGVCGCGDKDCERIGKHPAIPWGEITCDNQRELSHKPAAGEGGHTGYGIKTGAPPYGSGIVVVDVDGPEALKRWEDLNGGTIPATYQVATGRGWQWYFQHPGFRVPNSASELAQGIDIRGDGGFVVGPGSPHRNGKLYTVVCNDAPAPAPDWLLTWFRTQPERAPAETQNYPGDVDGAEREYNRKLFAEFCQTHPRSFGGSRHMKLFPVVQRGGLDLRLPDADILEIIAEHFNPRCLPPMIPSELRASVLGHCRGAKTKSTRTRSEPLPADLAHLVTGSSLALPPAPRIEGEQGAPSDGLVVRWGGWDAPVAPPVYLLEGLIPEHKVVTFFAEGGSLKTWAALSLAIAVARGEPWLGVYPVKKAPALYLDWEDGPYEFSRRVRMLTGGVDVPDLGYLYGGPQIDKTEFWIDVAKTVQARKIGLVVCDSLGAAMPGDAEENDTRFSAGVKLAGRCTEVGVTIAFVHHANKSGGLRGTSAIRDQSDVVFNFVPVTETDDVKRMRMVCDKPGPQKRPKPVNVELTDAGVRTFEEVIPARRVFVRTGDTRKDILGAIRSGPVVSKNELYKMVGGNKDRFKAEHDSMTCATEGDMIVKLADRYHIDSEDFRRARVLSCLARVDEVFRSAADLAKAAYVETAFVETLMRKGLVHRSAEGRIGQTDLSK